MKCSCAFSINDNLVAKPNNSLVLIKNNEQVPINDIGESGDFYCWCDISIKVSPHYVAILGLEETTLKETVLVKLTNNMHFGKLVFGVAIISNGSGYSK